MDVAHMMRGEFLAYAPVLSARCNHTHCAIDAGPYGCTEEKRKVEGKDYQEVTQDLR